MNRHVITAGLSALALSLIFTAPKLFAANNNSKTKYENLVRPEPNVELENPSGQAVTAKGTAGGIAKVTSDGMCMGTPIKVTANQVSDGSVATLVPGQWYEFKVVGGSSSYGDGCFRQGSAVVSCIGPTGTMTLEAGERFHEAFTANAASVDGGPLDQVTLHFLAMSSSGISVTIVPKVPCK